MLSVSVSGRIKYQVEFVRAVGELPLAVIDAVLYRGNCASGLAGAARQTDGVAQVSCRELEAGLWRDGESGLQRVVISRGGFIIEEGNKDVQVIVTDIREVLTISFISTITIIICISAMLTSNPDSLEYNFLVGVQHHLLVEGVVEEAEVVRVAVVVVVARDWLDNVRPDVAGEVRITETCILVPGDVCLDRYPVITKVLHCDAQRDVGVTAATTAVDGLFVIGSV